MKSRKEQRRRRHLRVRRRVRGTALRPRMSICLSNRHLYVQFVDDDAGRTLAAVATPAGRAAAAGCNRETARAIGEAAAKAATARGIERVVVDRGGFRYHGRVRAVVEAAVASGLKISDRTAPERQAGERKEPEEPK
jgi:large subunit ribosomal protein L18